MQSHHLHANLHYIHPFFSSVVHLNSTPNAAKTVTHKHTEKDPSDFTSTYSLTEAGLTSTV